MFAAFMRVRRCFRSMPTLFSLRVRHCLAGQRYVGPALAMHSPHTAAFPTWQADCYSLIDSSKCFIDASAPHDYCLSTADSTSERPTLQKVSGIRYYLSALGAVLVRLPTNETR